MSDKFYHPQHCFCLPCRSLRDSGVAKPAKKLEQIEEPKQKRKKRGA
jgi:hypothetical protein